MFYIPVFVLFYFVTESGLGDHSLRKSEGTLGAVDSEYPIIRATAFAAELLGAVMKRAVSCPNLLWLLPWAYECLTALAHPYVGVLARDTHDLEALKEIDPTPAEPCKDSREVMHTKGLAQGSVCNKTNLLLLLPSQPRRFVGIYILNTYMNIYI